MAVTGYKTSLDEIWFSGVYINRIHSNLILICVDIKIYLHVV